MSHNPTEEENDSPRGTPTNDRLVELSVHGRVCLFGEHTDWAGEYRKVNADIQAGITIVTGTDETIEATAHSHPELLIVSAVRDDGTKVGPWECRMGPELLVVAKAGGFWSYMAGVAYIMHTYYEVNGLVIDNHRTTLPLSKGLSSSAAICVLLARAFNKVYDLKLTIRGEMEAAYLGEILTPSKCGRMDQCCVFGKSSTVMTFDGDTLMTRMLEPAEQPIYLVVVDLCAKKDTTAILAGLKKAFPVAVTDIDRGVQKLLGEINVRIANQAIDALQRGDAQKVGELMTEAQAAFDQYATPACPSELTAAVLHKALAYPPIQRHIWGGKGVGSQGDGSAQFIARSKEDQDIICSIFEKELNMRPMKLTISSVRQAV